jgi:hypothetical protein
MSSLHRFVRATSLSAAAVLTLSASALLWAGTASAAAPNIYDLSAESIALASTATDPAVPLGIPFSIGAYGAGALLNSNGQSSADAGAPYSPLVSSLPSTGNGVASSTFGYGLPVVPKFPGYVSARYPLAPFTKQNAGGYELVASTDPSHAAGQVSIGGQSATSDQNNAFAFAKNLAGADGVFTEGAAGVHALTLGGILDVLDVSSYASLARDGGKTVPVTTTNLGSISFAGLTTGLTGDGFTALGSAPTPITLGGIDALNQALKPSGITLDYLPQIYAYTDGSTSTGPHVEPEKEVSGVISGALKIFLTNTSDRGTSTETITIGRVSLTATSTTLNADAPQSAAGPGTPDAGRAAGQLPSVGTDAVGTGLESATAPAAGALGSMLGPAPAPAPAGTTGATGTTRPTAAGITGGRLPTPTYVPAAWSAAYRIGTTSFESSFVVLVAAAAAALVGAQIVRLLAIRQR